MMAHLPYMFLLSLLPCKEQTSADSIVKVTAPQVTVYPGKSGALYIYVAVKKGYHIQAHKVNDEFIIPTTLDINADETIKIGKQIFPTGKKFKLEGTSDYLFVYDGKFKITLQFKAREKIQEGKYTLDAKLHYQACDNKSCFFPKTIDFSIALKVI